MRPSIQLNPKRLKYYREERALTLAALSKAVGLSLRRIQRIEVGGRTSPATADRLARELHVTLENLKSAAPLSKDDTAIKLVWVESLEYGFGGRLIDFSSGLKVLDNWLANAAKTLLQHETEDQNSPTLIVRMGLDGIEIRLHLPQRPGSDPYQQLKQSFVLRAALKESHGVNWRSFKQDDLDWIAIRVWMAAGNCADNVEFNGIKSPQTDDCHYAIVLHDRFSSALDCGPPEPDVQLVKTEIDVLRIFRRLTPTTDDTSGSSPKLLRSTVTDRWSVQVTNLPGRLSRKHIEILNVERLRDGTLRRIPWARPSRDFLASRIHSNKTWLDVRQGEPNAIFAPNLLAGSVLQGGKVPYSFGPTGIGVQQFEEAFDALSHAGRMLWAQIATPS